MEVVREERESEQLHRRELRLRVSEYAGGDIVKRGTRRHEPASLKRPRHDVINYVRLVYPRVVVPAKTDGLGVYDFGFCKKIKSKC